MLKIKLNFTLLYHMDDNHVDTIRWFRNPDQARAVMLYEFGKKNDSFRFRSLGGQKATLNRNSAFLVWNSDFCSWSIEQRTVSIPLRSLLWELLTGRQKGVVECNLPESYLTGDHENRQIVDLRTAPSDPGNEVFSLED